MFDAFLILLEFAFIAMAVVATGLAIWMAWLVWSNRR